MVDADFDTELDSLPRLIAEAAEPLLEIDDPAFGALFDRFGKRRFVHRRDALAEQGAEDAVDKPAPLTKVAPDAPVMLELAVERALSKDPNERPTAAELGEMLRDLIMGMRISSRARRSTDSYPA